MNYYWNKVVMIKEGKCGKCGKKIGADEIAWERTGTIKISGFDKNTDNLDPVYFHTDHFLPPK